MRKYIVSFFSAGLFLLSACSSGKLNVTIPNNIETEYGETLRNTVLYDKEKSDDDIKVKKVKDFDNMKIGEQDVTVVFVNENEKTKEEKVKITVTDTKDPEITLKKESVSITEGDTFDSAGNIESVKDPIDGDIRKSDNKDIAKDGYIIKSDVKTDTAGDYTVSVIAYDKNGNAAEKSYKVNVKAKPKEVSTPKAQEVSTPKQQAQNTQPSTTQYTESATQNTKPQQSSNNTSSSQFDSQPSQSVESNPVVSVPNSQEVYIAGSGRGKRYHSNPNCSNMKNPVPLTIEDAQARGYTPCKKCY